MFDKLMKKIKKKPVYENGGIAKDNEKYGTLEELKYAEDIQKKKPEVEQGTFGKFISNLAKNENMHDTVDRKRQEEKSRGFFKKR